MVCCANRFVVSAGRVFRYFPPRFPPSAIAASNLLYDRTVPARRSSLMPIVGILLNRLLLLDEEDFAETGDDV